MLVYRSKGLVWWLKRSAAPPPRACRYNDLWGVNYLALISQVGLKRTQITVPAQVRPVRSGVRSTGRARAVKPSVRT